MVQIESGGKMNKYQNSLDNFVKALSHFTNFKSIHDWKSDLQELVDKATPKKPINQSTPVVRQGYCPNCKGELRKLGGRNEVVLEGQLYCASCGQALDWGK
jgi:hypothetical protein